MWAQKITRVGFNLGVRSQNYDIPQAKRVLTPVEVVGAHPIVQPMELEITLPDEVPAMTLPNVTLFPQALMPLHIFEPRYREMLSDVLRTNRLFAVAGINPKLVGEPNQFEPPYRVASVGMVRACRENADGTSHLLLQGLCRVEFLEILTDAPYRRVRVRVLTSEPGVPPGEAAVLRSELVHLLHLKQKLGASLPREIAEFVRDVDDLETFADLAAFSLCEEQGFRQKLLETLDLRKRLNLLKTQLRTEIEGLKLHRKLQGHLTDDRIAGN
jgi:ATP-dependent Lon protease